MRGGYLDVESLEVSFGDAFQNTHDTAPESGEVDVFLPMLLSAENG